MFEIGAEFFRHPFWLSKFFCRSLYSRKNYTMHCRKNSVEGKNPCRKNSVVILVFYRNIDLSPSRRDTFTLASNLDHITTTNQKNWNFWTFFMFNLKAKIPGLEPKLVWGASIGKSLKNRLLFNSISSWLERGLLHQILVSVMHFSFLFPNLVLDLQSVKKQSHSGLPKTLSQNVQNRPPRAYPKIPRKVSLKSVWLTSQWSNHSVQTLC